MIPALKQRAVDLGLDTARFNDCLDSGVKWADVPNTTSMKV